MSPTRAKLTHCALLCRDVPTMRAFYTKVLGLVITDAGIHPRSRIHYTFLSGDPKEHHELV